MCHLAGQAIALREFESSQRLHRMWPKGLPQKGDPAAGTRSGIVRNDVPIDREPPEETCFPA